MVVDLFSHSSTGFPGAWSEEVSALLDALEEVVNLPRSPSRRFDVAQKVIGRLRKKGFRWVEKDEVEKQMNTLHTEFKTYLGLVKIGISTHRAPWVECLEKILVNGDGRPTRRRQDSETVASMDGGISEDSDYSHKLSVSYGGDDGHVTKTPTANDVGTNEMEGAWKIAKTMVHKLTKQSKKDSKLDESNAFQSLFLQQSFLLFNESESTADIEVHVTKPQASRNESAEIFSLSRVYSAPDRIDPKFLDASYLFKDVEAKNETKNNIDKIVKPSLKPEGYDEETSAYAELKASDFIMSENHLERLGKCGKIIFDDDDIKDHKLTTDEIKQCCNDIKVLGKGDLKSLLNWRKKIRTVILGSEDQKKAPLEATEDAEEKEIDEAIKEAEDIELSKLQEAKKKKKKILKNRKKLHDRMNLKMIIKDDEPVIDEDRELFKLGQIKNPKDLTKVEDDESLEFSLEPKNNDVNELLNIKFRSRSTPYNRDDRNVPDVKEEPEKEESLYSSDGELSSDIEFESDDDVGSDAEPTEAVLEGKKNPLIVDLVDRPDRVKDTVSRWFDKEEFMNASEDSDLELDLLAETYEKKKSAGGKKARTAEENAENSVIENTELTDAPDSEAPENNESESKKQRKKKRVRLDTEGLALGAMMVQSKKMKRDIIEGSYNRYSSNDENLPSWFVTDEKKHYKKQVPVTKELIIEYRRRLKEINARPIKKVVEAKARKKRRAERRMEKARKRAEKVTDHPDMSEKEKAVELTSIYKKALPKPDTNVTYVVAKKGIGRRVSRPTGVKGRFKVVDRRMKKDVKRMKELMKKQKMKPKKNVKNNRNTKKTGKKK